MKRPALTTLLGINLLAAILLVAPASGEEKFVIKMATLASAGSPWMQIFEELNREVMEKTDGNVQFKIYAGGILGDEKIVLKKMFVGQIQGAALTASSLKSIFNEIEVLQIPLVFRNHAEVDYVVSKMESFFKKGFEENGYVLLGWSEGGFVRLMSLEPVATLEDLRKSKVWIWEEAPLAHAIFKGAGVAAIPLTIPDVLVGLQTNMINVVYAPPAGAVDLQWFTKIKYITDVPLIFLTGGIVVKKNILDRMPVAYKQILLESAGKHTLELARLVRAENSEAIQVMQRYGVKLVTVSEEEKAAFRRLSENALQQPGNRSFSEAVLKKMSGYLEEFRNQKKP